MYNIAVMKKGMTNFMHSRAVAAAVCSVFVAVWAMAAAAEQVSDSQKSYAPQTIEFDGRTFYLHTELNGDTGKVISVYDENSHPSVAGEAIYVAGYSDLPPPRTDGDIFYYQVLYSANPAPELTDENGAYSAVARFAREWGGNNSEGYVFYKVRENDDSIVRISAWDANYYGKGIRMGGKRCGASRENAHVCISFVARANPGKYPTPQAWKDAEGAAELERVYKLLSEYPLTHNEELLADMAGAVK